MPVDMTKLTERQKKSLRQWWRAHRSIHHCQCGVQFEDPPKWENPHWLDDCQCSCQHETYCWDCLIP